MAQSIPDQNPPPPRDSFYSPERVATFSDGVIAIAITLLSFEIRVPSIDHPTNQAVWLALRHMLPELASLALSFFVISRYWVAHMRLMSEVTIVNSRFVGLNSVFLFWIVLIPFTTQLVSAHSGLVLPTVIYAANLALAGYWLTSIWAYLLRRPEFHNKQNILDDLRYHFRTSFIAPVIFSVSIPLALTHLSVTKYFWALIVLTLLPRLVRRTSS